MKYKSDFVELQKVFVKWWNNYMLMTFTLKNIFGPCMKYQSETDQGLPEISIITFRKSFYSKYNRSLLGVILDQIKGYRMEQDVNSELLKNTIKAIFINTGFEKNIKIAKDSVTKEITVTGVKTMKSYENDFEAAMLEETTSFYKTKAAEWRNQSASYFI